MLLNESRTSRCVALFLLLAICSGAVAVPAQLPQGRRERKVTASNGAITATPQIPAAPQTPAPSPPLVAPAPPLTAPPGAPQTLDELRTRIQEVMRQTQFASSHLAAKIVSLDTGRTLYEENANKWLQPASNLKLYTVAAALDRLSPDYRFITSVYASARPGADGAVRGDLVVYGRGDPTFAARFSEGDYFKAIDELAARIVAAGVRRVEGDLIGDESYFTGAPFAPGWEWDDLQWYYGAEISALSINDNSIDIFIKPGGGEDAPGVVTTGPSLMQEIAVLVSPTGNNRPVHTPPVPTARAGGALSSSSSSPPLPPLLPSPPVRVINTLRTTARGTPRRITIHRPLGENVIEVSGTLPVNDPGYTASVAIARPALIFTAMLRAALERQGVLIAGRTRTVDARTRPAAALPPISSLVEIANRQSPPLSIIAAQTLKPSQNLYTELILRALGRITAGADSQQPSDGAGIEVVRTFLRAMGVDPSRIVMIDGSGLSRANLVTAETTLELLTFMSRHRFASVFRDAQPIAGVDGTLRNRMKNSPAAGNARAKTGTLGTATTLSGYVTSAAGERLAFSLMINNPPREANPRADFTDAITILLASFVGRS